MSSPRVIRRRVAPGNGLCTPGQTFDGQTAASGDDGYSTSTGDYDSTGTMFVGRSANKDFDIWARWDNVTIPNGARIDSAFITGESPGTTGDDGNDVKTNIYFEDSDDAVAPTSQAEHAADVRTTAFTAWDDIDWAVDTPTDSDSIVDVVQEIVDRGSWASGNAMMMLWDGDDTGGGGRFYKIYSFNDTDRGPILNVEFCA